MTGRVVVLLAASLSLSEGAAWAQESRFESDLRREGEHIAKNCGEFTLKGVGNCTYTLVTDYPFQESRHDSFGV